jgi:2-polyprenyl-6-methoxyphenol hydroxylase-like FAD-dependent oxidoreductase
MKDETSDMALEYWSRSRVFLCNGCSKENFYLFFGAPVDDKEAAGLPVNTELWIRLFPRFRSIIERVGEQGRWDNFSTVTCQAWRRGRVAILGDAAHALPPYLGQGANQAFTNALALAQFVTGASDIPSALKAWEARMKPLTDHTQIWTRRYGIMANLWPSRWETVRRLTVRAITSIPYVERQLNLAARTKPIGSY